MIAPFIAIDGIDGTGKSTQVELLRKSLAEKFAQSISIRHPGHGALGEKLREILLHQDPADPISVEAQILLFQADGVESSYKAAELLQKGIPVVADRWHGSSWAYQGADLRREMILQDLNLWFFHISTRWPRIYFIIDDSLENCQKRLEGKKKDFFESKPLDYHLLVKNRFIDFANRNIGQGVIVLKAEDRTIADVHAAIIKVVNNNLHLNLKETDV